jgi:hypothetical protein
MATTAPERQNVLIDVVDTALNDLAHCDVVVDDGPPN